MNTRFDGETTSLILTWVGTACWVVCFWWMHRLSGRQQAMLEELQEVAKRIEVLSKAEHDMLQEVHPKVEKIEESVKEVAVAVAADSPGSGARQ